MWTRMLGYRDFVYGGAAKIIVTQKLKAIFSKHHYCWNNEVSDMPMVQINAMKLILIFFGIGHIRAGNYR